MSIINQFVSHLTFDPNRKWIWKSGLDRGLAGLACSGVSSIMSLPSHQPIWLWRILNVEYWAFVFISFFVLSIWKNKTIFNVLSNFIMIKWADDTPRTLIKNWMQNYLLSSNERRQKIFLEKHEHCFWINSCFRA